MKFDITEEQLKAIQKLSNQKALVDYMLEQSFGYYKVKDLLKAYEGGNLKVIK